MLGSSVQHPCRVLSSFCGGLITGCKGRAAPIYRRGGTQAWDSHLLVWYASVTLTICRALVSAFSGTVLERRNWENFLSSCLEIVIFPPLHSPLPCASIGLSSPEHTSWAQRPSHHLPKLLLFFPLLVPFLKGVSAVFLHQAIVCILPRLVKNGSLPLHYQCFLWWSQPPRMYYSRVWGQIKLTWLKHGQIKTYFYLMGPVITCMRYYLRELERLDP